MNDQNRVSFTRVRIDAEVLPKSGARDVWDSDVRGLLCRITPGGKTYYLCKWAEGGQRWIKIGAHPETSIKDARARALDLLADIMRGQKPWETRKLLRDEATLETLWESHSAHAKGRKRQSTLDLYGHAWVHLAGLHKRRVGSITRADVQREVDRVGKAHPIMANRVHSLVGVLYSTAIEGETWKGANPAAGVVRFREQTRDRYLKPEELRAWWLSLEYESEAWRVYFVAAVLCGARKSNISGMRWFDIDLERGVWRIPEEQSKNGEPLLIILTGALVSLLKDWRSRCESKVWVFPSAAGSKVPHVQDPKRPWGRVIARASLFRLVSALAESNDWTPKQEDEGRAAAILESDHLRLRAMGRREKITADPLGLACEVYAEIVRGTGREPDDYLMNDVHIHDLRRTLGSWATITGASLPIVGRALGHRSLSATQVYARLSMDPVRDAVETATEAIIGHGGDAATRTLSKKGQL